jgi:hypothetical protein
VFPELSGGSGNREAPLLKFQEIPGMGLPEIVLDVFYLRFGNYSVGFLDKS